MVDLSMVKLCKRWPEGNCDWDSDPLVHAGNFEHEGIPIKSCQVSIHLRCHFAINQHGRNDPKPGKYQGRLIHLKIGYSTKLHPMASNCLSMFIIISYHFPHGNCNFKYSNTQFSDTTNQRSYIARKKIPSGKLTVCYGKSPFFMVTVNPL